MLGGLPRRRTGGMVQSGFATSSAQSGRTVAQTSKRIALLLIDLQNSYFEFPELAVERDWLLPRVNELLAAAKRGAQPVILVRTEHLPDKSTWTLNMLQDGKGFAFPGSEQAAPLADLAIGDDTITVVKTRDDAFHETNLAEHLADLKVDGIVLCGVSTHSCVAQTATAAFARNIPCAVAQDATASEDRELAAALLAFLYREMRQPLLDQTSAVGVLDGSDPSFP